jgi:hypothetical protein
LGKKQESAVPEKKKEKNGKKFQKTAQAAEATPHI